MDVWLEKIRELVAFEGVRRAGAGWELRGARLRVPCVTIRPVYTPDGAPRFAFHEHPAYPFAAAVFDPAARAILFIHADGTYTVADVMLWLQYTNQQRSLRESLSSAPRPGR